MTWTTRPPTEDGYYWLARDGKQPIVVKVYDSQDGIVELGASVAFIGSDADRDLLEVTKSHSCRWHGPLTEPAVA